MRKRFVYVVLVPAVLIALIVVLFIDSWVEAGLEYAGERIVRARVEIDDLHIGLFPISMGWERLQVTDPKDTWKNLFETGPVDFTMDPGQLLRAKFIIETVRVEDFVLGTKRTTDGKIEQPPPRPTSGGGQTSFGDEAADVLSSTATSAPTFDIARLRQQLNLDSLTNPANFETYRLIDSLGRQLSAAEKQWDAALSDVQSTRDRISEIEARVRAIDVTAINSVESAQKAYTDAKQAYDGTRGVIQAVDQRRSELTNSVNDFSASIGSIDGAARRDFERAVAAAKLPDMSMKGLAQLVLGQEIMAQAEEYLGYVDLARRTIPKYTPKPDPNQPRRSEGVNVHFPEERSNPKLWIKEVVLSGGADSTRDPGYFHAVGTVRNISNNQRLTGEPITASLEARKGPVQMAVRLTFDRRGDQPHDTYHADISGISVADMPLGSSSFLPSRITDARAEASVVVDVPGPHLESSAKITFAGLRVAFERDPANAVERLTRDVLAGVRSFFVNLRLWKKESGAIDLAFETDLDDQLSGRARAVIGAEVARIRSDIQKRVQDQIARKRRELESAYAQKRADVQSRIAALEQEVRSKVNFVEAKKKELEDRIEQEKKKAEDAVKKKATDALKGILRKN